MSEFKIGQLVIVKNSVQIPFMVTGFYHEGIITSKAAEFVVISPQNNPLASATFHDSLLAPFVHPKGGPAVI